MHISYSSKPSNAVARFVHVYLQREATPGAATFIHPVPARAAHMMSFQFGGPVGVRLCEADVVRTAEPAALIGLQTHQRCQLLIQGYVETFVIVFRPSGVCQLFGIPAAETTNRDHAAHAVLGKAASALREKLGNARSFAERVEIADQFITCQSFRARPADSIESAASHIVLNHGSCRIDSLAHDSGLGTRTFQRRFQQRMGVSPKLYARIVRFESALKTRAAFPHTSWTTIAHQFGYHDHMHMVHDFKQLSGEAPTGILLRAEGVFASQIRSAPQHDTDLLAL